MAVTHDEHAKCAAEAQQNKALFIFRVIRVVYQFCPFIGEYRLGFVEADAVLFGIGGSFAFIPLEL